MFLHGVLQEQMFQLIPHCSAQCITQPRPETISLSPLKET